MDHLSTPLLVKTDLRSFFHIPEIFFPQSERGVSLCSSPKKDLEIVWPWKFHFFWNLRRSKLKMCQILSMKFWNVRNCTPVRGHFWPFCLWNVDFAQSLPARENLNPPKPYPMEIEKPWIHLHVDEGANNNLKTHAQRTFALGPSCQWPLHHII